jgi:hypothetical protein
LSVANKHSSTAQRFNCQIFRRDPIAFSGEAAEEAESDIPWLTVTTPNDTTTAVEYYTTQTLWVLETTPVLTPGAAWTEVTHPPTIIDDRVIYQLPRSPGEPSQFFRLRQIDDTEPPTFQAVPECGGPLVLVQFSEPVIPSTALNPDHYQLTVMPPIPIEIVQLQLVSPQTVMLQLNEPVSPGPVYQLQVHGVSDLAGNVMPPTMQSFTCEIATQQ